MTYKPPPRNPDAGNNITTARISDNAKAELLSLAKKHGLSLSKVTRKAIMAGLPIVKEELAQK